MSGIPRFLVIVDTNSQKAPIAGQNALHANLLAVLTEKRYRLATAGSALIDAGRLADPDAEDQAYTGARAAV